MQEAVRRGIAVVIATGRMYRSAMPYAQQLGLPAGPLITYNGALVREWPGGRTVWHQPVALADALEVVEFARAHPCYLQVYLDDEYYFAADGPPARRYAEITGFEGRAVGPLGQFLRGLPPAAAAPTKLLLLEEPERLDELQPLLDRLVGGRLYLTRSYPFFLELMDRGVSKGAALAAVATRLGVRPAEILAIGDSPNDLPMLEVAGHTAAVADAAEAVRRRAQYVTGGRWGDGVAEAIRRFALEG